VRLPPTSITIPCSPKSISRLPGGSWRNCLPRASSRARCCRARACSHAFAPAETPAVMVVATAVTVAVSIPLPSLSTTPPGPPGPVILGDTHRWTSLSMIGKRSAKKFRGERRRLLGDANGGAPRRHGNDRYRGSTAAGSSSPGSAKAAPACLANVGRAQLVTVEYDGLPVKRDQLHRARELVMDGVSAARSASLMVGRGPSRGIDHATPGMLRALRPAPARCPAPAERSQRATLSRRQCEMAQWGGTNIRHRSTAVIQPDTSAHIGGVWSVSVYETPVLTCRRPPGTESARRRTTDQLSSESLI